MKARRLAATAAVALALATSAPAAGAWEPPAPRRTPAKAGHGWVWRCYPGHSQDHYLGWYSTCWQVFFA